MRRVRVTLPATATDFGTGPRALGLALGLTVTVELVERTDDQLVVETTGEDAGLYPLGWRHPVIVGLARVYQRLERAAPGLAVRVENRIPADIGLGGETALLTAGMMGANNLLGNPFTRDQIGQMAAQATGRPDQAITALHGGLTATLAGAGEEVHFRRLPVAALSLVLVRVEPPRKPERRAAGERITQADALHTLARLPFLIDGLRTGDAALLAAGMDDRLFAPQQRARIPLYDDTWDFVRRNGAATMTPLGAHPALLVFPGKTDARKLADLLQAFYADEDQPARVWVVNVDTQGVVVSVAQTG